MLLKTLKCVAVLACVVSVLAGLPASADDQKDAKDKPALSGVWVHKAGEMKIEFADKDVLKLSPHGKDEVILIVCKYTLAKDGLVKAKVTEFEGKPEFQEKVKELLPAGTEFSFTWKVKNAAAALDDVKGEKADALKSHLEGEYEKKN